MANSNRSKRNNRGKGGKRRNHGNGGKNQSSQQGGRSRSRSKQSTPDFVLVGETLSYSASVTPGYLPLNWEAGNAIQLLKPGLYLRYKGALAPVSRGLGDIKAVLYALWDDTEAIYRVGRDRWIKPGANAGFLVKNPLDDGPPWLPVQAHIRVDGTELDEGLLSSWVDHIHCVPFTGTLSQGKEGLTIASKGRIDSDVVAGDDALLETLRWLKNNPDDESAAAVTARMMLIDQGHGLQRAGICLTHYGEERSRELMDELLPVFAPVVAPLIRSIWNLWRDQDSSPVEAVKELATELRPHLNDKSPLQESENLAVLITWISGIFGARPDRQLTRPSRSLFAVLRYIRKLNNRVDLIGHPDSDPPTFPLNHTETESILLDLSRFPDRESDFERLVRAMAVGESTHDFGRPNLDHIRPFKIGLPRVHDYPIATRTLISRYDGILTAWSFRGLEISRKDVDPKHLAANLIFEVTSTAGVRGIARVLGSGRNASESLAEAIRIKPQFGPGVHPHYQALATLPEMTDEELIDQAEKASRAGKAYENRLLDGLSAHEFLVARNDSGNDSGYQPVAPEWGDDVEYPVRRQFMFWRAFCRSTYWGASETYGAFFDEMIPRLAELPSNLENEALALLRNWLRHDDSNVERATSWTATLDARLDALLNEFAAEETHWDERFSSLFAALSILDRPAFLRYVERAASLQNWNFRDLGRILDAVRHAGWQHELIDEPAFRILHTRLIDAEGPHADLGRVEWTRKTLERANQSAAIRWFVHRDSFPQVTFSPAFREWFREHGLRAIEKPDDAVIELLQVALRTIDVAQLDVVLHHINRVTSWPDDEIFRLLVDSERFDGATAWLLSGDRFRAERANRLIAGLRERSASARRYRAIAALIRQFAEHGESADESVKQWLQSALVAHEATADLPESAGEICDAWRIAQLDGSNEAALDFGEAAAHAFIKTGDREFAEFVSYVVESTVSQELKDDIDAALRDQANAELLARRIEGFEWPPELLPVLAALSQLSARSHKGKMSYSALVSFEWTRVLEGNLHAAISAKRESLTTALSNLEAVLASKTVEAPEVTDASSEEAPAPPEETAPGQETGETPPDSSEEAEQAVGTEFDEETLAFAQRSANAASKSLREVLKRTVNTWQRFAETETPSPADTRRLSNHTRLSCDVRTDILGTIRDLALSDDVKVNDPRRLLRTDYLDTRSDVDPFDVQRIFEILAILQGNAGATREISVSRRAVEFSLALEGDEQTEADASEGNGKEPEISTASEQNEDTADGDAEEADDDTGGADGDAEDTDRQDVDESDDRGDEDDSGGDDDDESDGDESLTSRLRASLRGEGGPDDSSPWPSASIPPLLRAIVGRNDSLKLRFNGRDENARAVLSWRDYR